MKLGLAALAMAVATVLSVAGCSPEVGFPAVHDMPAPRPDTPLTAAEVKQATDTLISERDRLSTVTQANGTGTKGAGQPGTVSSTSGTATSDARKKPSTATQSGAPGADADAPVTAGAYAKP